MLYSLASEPSSALDLVASKTDYYESCIIAMYTKATAQNDSFEKLIKNKVVNTSNDLLSSMCEVYGVTDTARLIDVMDINDSASILVVEKCVKNYYPLATASKICEVVNDIFEYGTDIIDVIDRLALYGEMVNLDDSTKLWLTQLYETCDASSNIALKDALFNLKTASTDYAGAALVEVKTVRFTLSKWVVSETMDEGMKVLVSGNPITAAVFAGLNLGKTVCNLFFATDDVCEQLFVMNCIYDIQNLARTVAENCKNTFINDQSSNNALAFTYAVDCYFESIINVDIDCMKTFLDKLYNGGIIKGSAEDYQEHINVLDDLKKVRKNKYNAMINYFMVALMVNFPETYEYYYDENVSQEASAEVSSIRFVENNTSLFMNYTFINPAVAYPVNAVNREITYSSSNTSVATVDASGTVTPVNPGTVTIYATTANGTIGSSTITVLPFYATDVDGGYAITDYVETERNVVIPSTAQDGRIISIGYRAFCGCTNLSNINIPDSVISIGDDAFCGCTNLSSINIPDSVISIGNGALGGCTNLSSVNIPDSVISIGDNAFDNCKSLESITVSENNTEYSTIDGVLLNKNKTDLIKCPEGKKGIYSVPESVLSIGNGALGGCTNLSSVNIPDSVISIGVGAFYNCTSLTNINLSYNVTSIGGYAFHDCTSLTNINLPDNLTFIGDFAFWGCTSLINVKIQSVKNIGEGAFKECINLECVNIQNSVTTIGKEAFFNCASLTNVNIPGLVSVDDLAFWGCTSLKSITIPKTVVSIGGANFGTWGYGWDYPGIYVYYEGSASDFANISVGTCNEYLVDAIKHYNGLGHEIITEYDADTDMYISYCPNGCEERHEYVGTISVEPTCITEGTKIYTCSLCETPHTDDSFTAEIAPTGKHVLGATSGGVKKCTVCDFVSDLRVGSASVTLEADLTVNIKVRKDIFDGAGYTDPYVVAEKNGVTYVLTEYTIDDDDATKPYYVFAFKNFSPYQIGDGYTAVVHGTKDGVDIAGYEVHSYSIMSYLAYQFSAAPATIKGEALKTLIADLLVYGYEHQLYMGYNIDNNAISAEDLATYATAELPVELENGLNLTYATVENPTAVWKAASLTLESTIEMNVKFTVDDIEGVSVEFKNEDGVVLDTVTEFSTETKNGELRYVANTTKIKANMLYDLVHVTVYKDGVAISNTLQYSVETYAYNSQRNATVGELCVAMMKYGYSAEQYFDME